MGTKVRYRWGVEKSRYPESLADGFDELFVKRVGLIITGVAFVGLGDE